MIRDFIKIKPNVNPFENHGVKNITIREIKNIEFKADNYIRRERLYGEVIRSFYIGEKKESDIKASYQNGILTISFPKEELPHKESQNIIIK